MPDSTGSPSTKTKSKKHLANNIRRKAMNTLAHSNELINSVFGIDRFFHDIDSFGSLPNYPPHSVYEWNTDNGERVFRIDIAVAGFAKDDLSVRKEKDTIYIEGNKNSSSIPDNAVQRKSGIGYRKFKLKFKVMENIIVDEVSLQDGILGILLREIVPEEHRPVVFEIGDGPVSDMSLENNNNKNLLQEDIDTS